MNPADIQTLVTAAQTIATVLSGLGVPGLIALGLAGPVVLLVTVLVLDYVRHAHMERMHQEFRKDAQEILEAYRADVVRFNSEYGERHNAVSRFYENNVTLVKNYEMMTEALQTLVINNTRATERLVTIVEARNKA